MDVAIHFMSSSSAGAAYGVLASSRCQAGRVTPRDSQVNLRPKDMQCLRIIIMMNDDDAYDDHDHDDDHDDDSDDDDDE